MNSFSALRRRQYATVRQLEKFCYSLLKPVAVVMFVSILMILTSFLAVVGVVLIIMAGLTMISLFYWMIQLQKQPTVQFHCPYCTNKVSVFTTANKFDCDFCDRPLIYKSNGTIIPADPSFANAKPTSVFDNP